MKRRDIGKLPLLAPLAGFAQDRSFGTGHPSFDPNKSYTGTHSYTEREGGLFEYGIPEEIIIAAVQSASFVVPFQYDLKIYHIAPKLEMSDPLEPIGYLAWKYEPGYVFDGYSPSKTDPLGQGAYAQTQFHKYWLQLREVNSTHEEAYREAGGLAKSAELTGDLCH